MAVGRTIKVGPIAYTMREIGDLHDGGKRLFGQVNYDDCEILIHAGNAAQQRRQTVWHEIVHIILTQAGRNEDSGNEQLVDALAYGLMDVIESNPWLTEGTKAGSRGGNNGREDAG